MIHIGDITKIDWTQVEPVDVVTGGSPCQDLSVAGARAGLDGARSGLFYEQIRCIKEMRENAKRATGVPRPRFCVWENVKGAYSSNGGKDFQSVLTEFVKVVREDAPDVPLPAGGRWPHSGCLMGRGADGEPFSIAWRLHDAQFWGVAQRRQRVSVVADFGGTAAPEVSFVRQGLQGHPDAGGAQRKGAADGASPRAGAAISFQERAGKPGGGKGILIQPEHVGALSTLNNQSVCYDMDNERRRGPDEQGDICSALTARGGTGGNNVPVVVEARGNGQGECAMDGCLNPWDSQSMRVMNAESVCRTLQSPGKKTGQTTPFVFDARGNGDGQTANTITGDHQDRVTDYSAIAVQAYSIGAYTSEGMKSENPHSGIHVADQARTLDLNGENPGCNQGGVAIVAEQHGVAYACGNGQSAQIGMHEKTYALDCMHDQQSVVVFDKEMYNSGKKMSGEMQARIDDVSPTVRADSHPSGVCYGYIVRRLTPKECERLQGFPDDWTNLGEWTDSKDKRHKDADSPRYKALGNSIALPYWYWLLRRIAAQYDGPATLGSLFDGIGGFPLCWERVNGKGSARWASEIEEFPMAVTKRRFPDEPV